MASGVISESELVDALVAATQRPDAPQGFLTLQDYVKLTGWHRGKVASAIGHLAMQERIEVQKVSRPDIGGRPVTRPAYKILPKKKR